MLERSVAMAGKKIKVQLKIDILGTILKKVEMKVEVVTVLQVNRSRLICTSFLKTLGHTPMVRNRNLIINQQM